MYHMNNNIQMKTNLHERRSLEVSNDLNHILNVAE